ncbi:MAG TPA: FG-GAP-like repeat-containing protein [Pyrinomonadaceae bacterium]|nr:FG-GAP-like repeat-containing protein [Pyrinomonadaceae bacterium]
MNCQQAAGAQARRARAGRPPSRNAAPSPREAAYRANNFGVALLEQFRHREGADEFRRALRLDPRNALARINLAVALYNVPDVEGAIKAARAAVEVAPRAPQPHYILGLIAKNQNRADDAMGEFKRVLEVDPDDTGANVLLGQIYLQQRDFKEATALFRRAVEAEPYNGTALYNLATALLRAGERDEGQRVMQRFQELRTSGAATIIGQNYLEQGRYAEAVTSTGAESDLVERATPRVRFVDATARVLPAAKRSGAVERGKKHSEARSTPTTGEGSAPHWTRHGECGWSASEMRFGGSEITLFDFDGDGDLDLLDLKNDSQRLLRNDRGKFVDVTPGAGALSGNSTDADWNYAAVAGDYDNDGREDLFVLRRERSALLHNDGGGKFSDRTEAAGLNRYKALSNSAAFADVDHDGDLDIFIAGGTDWSKMSVNISMPLSATSQITPTRSQRSSVERKEPTGLPNVLLRNNGDGTFADITSQAKVAGEGGESFQIIPTDFDNRRDVDLLVVNRDTPPLLYRNVRDGTFRNVAAEAGLDLRGFYYAAAAGDVNKDNFTDFYFAAWNSPDMFALSDGRGRFRLQPAPSALGETKDALPASAQFVDYDNDGLLDLLTLSSCAQETTPHLWRNVGDGWVDVSGVAFGRGLIRTSREAVPASTALASGDVDGDGDTDLFVRSASDELIFLRNDGGNRNASVRVRLAGKVSNRSGVGAKIEVRAGSLQQKLETYAATPALAPADINFGLGRRASADAVRVIWPSGVVQAETRTATREGAQTATRVRPGALKVTELDRKPSSCPYLYTWNGSRFEFITDFMGGGEMGAWAAPGVFNTPDPDEYVRIRGDQLKELGGRYELRVTNELEEALFVDRLQLVAVAHPAGVEVYPNEGLGNPTGAQFKLYATRNARPPRSARDEHGHDVLTRLERLDRKYVDDFALLPVRGYAEEHTLTLDLGDGTPQSWERGHPARQSVRQHASKLSLPLKLNNDAQPIRADALMAGRMPALPASTLLLLTGWTDYAFSSDNVAASQRGLEMKPPALQVRDEEGKWRTVVENVGIPVGRPQTVTVDLAGKFLSASREVRLVTNMRVYWDRILFDDSAGDAPVRVERLEASDATLRERGFSAEVTPDGREPFGYDYARVSLASPWKAFPGRYTRFGDVRELLRAPDDIFVVSRPGDELALSFDARSLAPLPAGWTRTFLLYADGFSKEMDINSASPHELAPLPFHGMKSYPYAAPESYPADDMHQSYIERYNTRVVTMPVPRIEANLNRR